MNPRNSVYPDETYGDESKRDSKREEKRDYLNYLLN